MKISSLELMMAGWHRIWKEGVTYWVSPITEEYYKFPQAARILRKQGTNPDGSMKGVNNEI